MENQIGVVSDAKILSGDRRAGVSSGTYITLITEENVTKGQMLEIFLDKERHNFEVTDISITEGKLSIDAREVGYWARKIDRKKDFDLRSLLGVEVTVVTDAEKLKQINTESCWC